MVHSVRVTVSRGPVIESEHTVHAVVSDADGPVTVHGDPDRPVIARSAIKSIQAVPLLRTGAAEAFDCSDEEIALACSSHSGEPAHVEAVAAWLERLDLGPEALECGPDLPIDADARAAVHRAGGGPEALFNCCSGKHAGFLTVARHLGFDPAGYIRPDHPVQRLVTEAIESFTGHSVAGQTPGRDGCAIPTFAIPIRRLARGMARLVRPDGLDAETTAAAERLVAAPQGRQFWVAGTGRHEVHLGELVAEPLVVKAGAEGVFMAAVPSLGVGVALKVADGASRAAEVGISAVLADLGLVDPGAVSAPVKNKSGTVVGAVEAVRP